MGRRSRSAGKNKGPLVVEYCVPAQHADTEPPIHPLPNCAFCGSTIAFGVYQDALASGQDEPHWFMWECCAAMECVACHAKLTSGSTLIPQKCELCGSNHPAHMSAAAKITSLHTLALKEGNAMAQYNLAMKYRDGICVKQDGRKAAQLCELAIAQGHADACIELADMLLGAGRTDLSVSRTGIPHDFIRGVALMKHAAGAGHHLVLCRIIWL